VTKETNQTKKKKRDMVMEVKESDVSSNDQSTDIETKYNSNKVRDWIYFL
jgi:hypothetical protein